MTKKKRTWRLIIKHLDAADMEHYEDWANQQDLEWDAEEEQ